MYELNVGEIIKDIKWFEGIYAVSSEGRIWSYRRKKWLKPSISGNGYLSVTLHNKGANMDLKVHRLVAMAFIRNILHKPQVNHLNGIKSDNRASNLAWVTPRENHQHACDNGLNTTFKLSFKDKIAICKMFYFSKLRKSYIAKLYKLSSPGVGYVIDQYLDDMLMNEPAGNC